MVKLGGAKGRDLLGNDRGIGAGAILRAADRCRGGASDVLVLMVAVVLRVLKDTTFLSVLLLSDNEVKM